MCRSESGSRWVIKPALFDTRSISDTHAVRALQQQQQLSLSVWFHCVCGYLGPLTCITCIHVQSVRQTTPSHRHHGGCNVPPPPKKNLTLLRTVELTSKSPPPFSGEGSLTRLWIGVCSPGWQTFTLPRQNFPTLSTKKGKITTLARISVACYLVMAEQQSEYTHNSKLRWHTCLVCQPPWSEHATLTVNSSGCLTHQGNSLDTLNWSVYRGYYM